MCRHVPQVLVPGQLHTSAAMCVMWCVCAVQVVSHAERSWCMVSHCVFLLDIYTYTPLAHMPLCIFIWVRYAVSLTVSASVSHSLSSCRSLPPPPITQLLLSPHTHVLPLLPQMGWVESWLRTFMPKTTCHPSLLLSRMVMLWEVSMSCSSQTSWFLFYCFCWNSVSKKQYKNLKSCDITV